MNTINGNFLERTIPSLKGTLVTLNIGNSTFEMNLEDLATNLGAGVTSIIAGSGISVDQSTGNVTVSATGGGGGTNPTSTYVPYNNEGTFADSYIINDTANSVLKTYVGDDKGLYFDFANNSYTLGDYAGFNYNTKFIIDDNNQIIKTSNNATDKGLFLDFANNAYSFGDNANTNYLEIIGNQLTLSSQSNRIKIDGDNNEISTFCNNQNIGLFANPSSVVIGETSSNNSIYFDLINNIIKTQYLGNDTGLFLDFVNLQYKFGDFSTGRQTHLLIDNNNEFVSFYHNTNQRGLKLDFTNQIYSFGQLNGGNGTKLEIDDANQKLILSANLETASAGSGAAGKRLKITIGGNDYLIDLITP
jgi:hypothetical protein